MEATVVLKCEQPASRKSWSYRACGEPAIMAERRHTGSGKVEHEPYCKRHVGIEKRRRYGATLIELTPEIVEEISTRQAAQDAAEAERRAAKQAEAEQRRVEALAQREAEAKQQFTIAYNPDKRTDWSAVREGKDGTIAIQQWQVTAVGQEIREAEYAGHPSVKVVESEGPVTVEVRNANRLDINEALALVQALTAAIGEAAVREAKRQAP